MSEERARAGQTPDGAGEAAPVDVTFYVPCLNEAENVGAVIEMVAAAAARHGLGAEILVYDDGSTDGTGEAARAAFDRLDLSSVRTELIRNEDSRGLGANFFAGARRGVGEHYLLVNGDHSERAETLDAVLSRLGDADLVVTVFADGDRRGVARRALSRLFTGLVNRLSGHRLRYYNGPVLHRREDVVRFATDCRGFAYQAELLTRELDAGRSAVEVPMENRQRESGSTKAFAPSNLLSVARSLWRVHFRRFEASAPPKRRWTAFAVLGLLLPLALGFGLRLWDLGAHDIRSSEIGLALRLAQAPGFGEIYGDHLVQFAQFRQMPVPRLAARMVTAWTPDVDVGTVRLASALVGALAVAALWWLGFEVGGATLALLVALLAATQPFGLAWGRTAQVYSFLFTLSALFAAAVAAVTARILRRGYAGPGPWAVAVLAAVGVSYCHVQAWLPVLLGWGLPLAAARSWRGPRGGWGWWVYLAPAVWFLTLTPWIKAWLGPQLDGSVPLWSGPSLSLLGQDLVDLWTLPFTFGFGAGWRGVLGIGLPALALAAASTRRTARPLAALLVPVVMVLTVQQTAGGVRATGFVTLGPLWLLLVGLGGLAILRTLDGQLPARWRPLSAVALSLALLAIVAGPVRAVLALRGSPVEYSRLADALDGLVGAGVPALVNGKGVVELEMRPHLPERALPTFTVPDANFAEWHGNRWRETAEAFLLRFSDAPLVQQGRNYYGDPLVGPWRFPEAAFSQRLVLRNEPAIYLGSLRLGTTRDFYGTRTTTEISYNRPEDLVVRAKAAGEPTVALWGGGWGYLKTTELDDWRLLRERADIVVHNLTDAAVEMELVLDIDLPLGLKSVRLHDDRRLVESANKLTELRFQRTLPPGEQTLTLVDDHYGFGRVPLRVGSIRLEPPGEEVEVSE